jgi:predicted RNase H-like nuclease (RuvC/YqgF family)
VGDLAGLLRWSPRRHRRGRPALEHVVTATSGWLAHNLPTVLAGVAVPAITYAAVRRQRSGHVSSSEAADLWRESGEIRRELRTEINQVYERVRGLTAENEELRREVSVLRTENETLRAQCTECIQALQRINPGSQP